MPFTTLLAVTALAGPDRVPKPFDVITPATIQASLRFLSNDLLEGRGTPSRGLDIASEYIASQFQIIGLQSIEQFVEETAKSDPKPTGLDGYFQITEFENRRTNVKAPVRNVIGILPGSDPKLKNSYVLVTGHYDHLGMRVLKDGSVAEPGTDLIFNGANDDGSGTVGVIECARALSQVKPKRTVVFMCFWGEEMGLRGSSYYCKNPALPLKDTVTDINLEQIGRTDDTEGPRVSEFNLTGFDFTDLSEYLAKAASAFGVKVTMHPKLSTPYFNASDNAAFASAGVPANTVSTSYEFPDYHQVGDEWPKIDYENMTKIVRSVCAGVLAVANSKDPVKWNEKNEKTKRYVDAWKSMHSQGGV